MVEVVAVDFNREAVVAAAAHAAALVHLVGDQFGIFGKALAQLFLHFEDGLFAVVLLGAADTHADFVVGGAVEECGHAGVVVGACRGGYHDDVVAQYAVDVVLHVAGGLEGFLDTCAALQLGGDADAAVVLLFHEVHADGTRDDGDERHDKEGCKEEEGGQFVLEAPTEEVGVSGLDGIEGFADS